MPRTRSSTRNSSKRAKVDDSPVTVVGHGTHPSEPAPDKDSEQCCPDNSPGVPDFSSSHDDVSASTNNNTHTAAAPAEPFPEPEKIQAVRDGVRRRELDILESTRSKQSDVEVGIQNLVSFMDMISPSLSDGQVHAKPDFDNLRKSIHSASHLFKSVTWAQLNVDERNKARVWAPKAEQLMKSHAGKKALFQAWMWHILDDNIFSANPSTKWQVFGDSMQPWHLVGQTMTAFQEFDNIEDHSTPEDDNWIIKYNVWKGLSADLARQAARSSGSIPYGYAAKLIKDELGHLMDDDPCDGRTLEQLSEDAAVVDQHLMCARIRMDLSWDTGSQSIGFPFSKTDTWSKGNTIGAAMVPHQFVWRSPYDPPEPEYEGEPVELVVAPGLVLHGRILGRDYDVVNRGTVNWLNPMVVAVGKIPGPGN